MANENLIDNLTYETFESYIEDKGEILWEGKPNPKFSISFLELGGDTNVMTGPVSGLGVVLGGTIYGVYHYVTSGNIIFAILVLMLGISILAIPDYIKNKRKQNTLYAFTNKSIHFQLWRWGKKTFHTAKLTDIKGFSTEEYDDGYGTLHLFPKTHFNFDTHDFISSKKRFYPTLEDIPEVVKVKNKLESIKKSAPR